MDYGRDLGVVTVYERGLGAEAGAGNTVESRLGLAYLA